MTTNEPSRLRSVVWGVALAVYVGALIELVLVSHYEGRLQILGLVIAGLGMSATVWGRWSGSGKALRATRWASALVLVGSVVGIGLHLKGNIEFALEVSSGASLLELAIDSVTGGAPLLAPGMLAVGAVLAGSVAGWSDAKWRSA